MVATRSTKLWTDEDGAEIVENGAEIDENGAKIDEGGT